MAGVSQYREPERAPTEVCSFASGNTHPGGALLCVRLWTSPETAEPSAADWHGTAPAVCLTTDLLAASGCVASGVQGNLFVADFPSVPLAFSAARRLQWAVQGLAESEELRGSSIAVSVQSGDETVGMAVHDTLAASLQYASPGQILVTEKTGQLLSDIPGLSMQPTGTAQVLELLWQAPEGQSSRAADEQTLAQLMEKHGLGDRVYGERPSESSFAFAGASESANSEWAAQPEAGNWTQQFLHGNGRWVLVGAAVLLIAAIGIFFSSHGSTASSGQASGSIGAGTPSQTTDAGSDQRSQPQKAQASENSKTDRQAQILAQKNAQKASPKAPQPQTVASTAPVAQKVAEPPAQREPVQRAGKCDDLDESMIPAAIDQAEKSLARGKYDAAQRQFGAVLGCQPGNGRARDGLDRVRRAKEAEGLSSN